MWKTRSIFNDSAFCLNVSNEISLVYCEKREYNSRFFFRSKRFDSFGRKLSKCSIKNNIRKAVPIVCYFVCLQDTCSLSLLRTRSFAFNPRESWSRSTEQVDSAFPFSDKLLSIILFFFSPEIKVFFFFSNLITLYVFLSLNFNYIIFIVENNKWKNSILLSAL